MKSSEPSFWRGGAIGELAGKAELAHRRLARDVLLLPPADALLGAVDDEGEEPVGLGRVAGEPMVEMIPHRVLDDALGLHRGELVLGLALELRLADEDGEECAGRRHHVIRGDDGGALVLGHLGIVADRAGERGAEALLMRAALGRGDGVAVGGGEAVIAAEPGHRPFDRAVASFLLDAA